MKIKRLLLTAAVLLMIPAACGSNDSSDTAPISNGTTPSAGANLRVSNDEYYSYDYVETYEIAAGAEAGYYSVADTVSSSLSGGGISQSERLMFIKRANISIQTDNFDEDTNRIRNIINSYGGYFESSNLYTPNSQNPRDRKRYNAVIRIPVEVYEPVKEAIEDTGKLVSSQESTEEVSAQYFNTQSRLTTLKTEEARLIELIDEAEDLRVLIQLEQRLANTKTQIEQHEMQLKRLESQTSFSTITLNMQEVTPEEMIIPEEPDESFIGRVTNGFINSAKATAVFFQNVLVFIAYIAVPLAFAAFVVLVVRRVIKRRVKINQPQESFE